MPESELNEESQTALPANTRGRERERGRESENCAVYVLCVCLHKWAIILAWIRSWVSEAITRTANQQNKTKHRANLWWITKYNEKKQKNEGILELDKERTTIRSLLFSLAWCKNDIYIYIFKSFFSSCFFFFFCPLRLIAFLCCCL